MKLLLIFYHNNARNKELRLDNILINILIFLMNIKSAIQFKQTKKFV